MICRSRFVLLVALFVFFSLSAFLLAGQRKILLDFADKVLSADLKEVPLRDVLNKIKKQKGIWVETGFMRNESLLDEKISVQFKELSLQDALERILSHINHSLVFDQSKLVGVMVFGKPGKRRPGRRSRTLRGRTPRRSLRGTRR